MFNRVIVSTDDSGFKKFWPMVSMAWNKFFPDVKVTCGFVTDLSEDDDTISEMRTWGEVVTFPVIKNIPKASQGKMTRLILSSRYDEEICLIDDIDSIPLQRNYVKNLFSDDVMEKIHNGFLMALAGDAYINTPDSGKFPMGYLTAKGKVIKKIINPLDQDLETLYSSWSENHIDGKESVLNEPIETFSDESLVRFLISQNPINIVHVNRNCDISKYWIDRSWWGYDRGRLFSEDYVMCNFTRPSDPILNKEIIEYLNKK
jgi:hypothetical protein